MSWFVTYLHLTDLQTNLEGPKGLSKKSETFQKYYDYSKFTPWEFSGLFARKGNEKFLRYAVDGWNADFFENFKLIRWLLNRIHKAIKIGTNVFLYQKSICFQDLTEKNLNIETHLYPWVCNFGIFLRIAGLRTPITLESR